ncbi:MAG: Do family serine endopeptidase [Schleiferiaceae bacterium]|nr:Do family serine endopeptidase [Schleiferiaceae bacterium]
MKNTLKFLGIAILGGIISLTLFKMFFEQEKNITIVNENPAIPALRTGLAAAAVDFTEAAEMTVNAVVHVKTSMQTTGPQYSNPLEELFFGSPRNRAPRTVTGSGSGVIITENGYIITNNHVIDKAQKILVTLNDNREYEAEVIGTDRATDIALLKIKEKGLPFLSFFNSDEVRLGEWVLAVGNPYNLTSTVTAGIVSAKGRNINIIPDQTAIESFIQTDAAVNPGNSGGALVNVNGDLVGINTAISSQSGSFVGYSFAVPSNIVKKVVEDMMEFGLVQRAYLGVNISDISTQMMDELDLPQKNGVYVSGILDNGAAGDAGIKRGDIIVKVNNREVKRTSELQEAIGRQRPGDKVTVGVIRKGKLQEFEVQLRNKQGELTPIVTDKIEGVALLGATFKELDAATKKKMGVTNGVSVSSLIDGKLKRAGVTEGFVILKINNQRVNTPDEVSKIVNGLSPGDGLLIQGIHANGKSDYFAFGM